MSAVTVVGAGIVGISCALELQRRGHRVTLLDRHGIGEETSSGNAGILSYSTITPLAAPELLGRMLRLALNRDADFRLHYAHLVALTPWLLRFLLRCRRSVFLADGEQMAALTLPSIDLHRQWIAEAGAENLLNQGGVLKVYRQPRSFDRDALQRELLDRCGVKYTLVGADEIYQLEPDLRRIFNRGVLVESSISIRDPRKLCQAYARLFIEAGGCFERRDVSAIAPGQKGWMLSTEQGERRAEHLVLCLGAWTPQLLGPLGYRNPLALERGYHMIYAADAGATLTRPIFDVDASYVMAPMETGLRVSSGTNLLHREAASDPRQLRQIDPRVREAFPLAEALLQEPWMGRRPTVPDSLPLLGPAPRHQNLWLAFAHSHMGLTMGPISGRLIANFVDRRQQPFPLDAINPARYL